MVAGWTSRGEPPAPPKSPAHAGKARPEPRQAPQPPPVSPMAPPRTSCAGWEILDAPRVPHEQLESPSGCGISCGPRCHGRTGGAWRWGRLRQDAGWPLFLPARTTGLCVWPEKLILVDEAQQRGRTVAEFIETLLHELIQTRQTPCTDAHDAQFAEALKRAKAYYFGPTTAPAPRASASQKGGQDGVRDAEDVRRHAGAENRGAARL